ncbi:putative isotrichodermin c-15 hydroxylase [Diaporthe ampelina]|uniref:Putative isotrichodermin c-15 hydroxylase n=1 Tax=Diaporthe ampelina TaxID=1214573 RepID=A0A0G2FB16_9PEZI|nr:putative isotrichodermin c-15 hydroxylase [Diaporthe ampelina]
MYENGEPPRVSTARDPAVHAQQRKTLSNAFSAKALRDQEEVIQRYVDLFVQKLDEWGESGKKAINVTPAYNWLMFDIIARNKALRRMEMGDMGRMDFFSHILARGAWDVDTIASHTQLLVISGSEPIATALAATTYYLLKNPETLKNLQGEVRSAFSSDREITGDATSRLEYLNAVIEEGLRLFPPSVVPLSRYSPGATIGGHYVPAGVSVFNNGYPMSRDPRYWDSPHLFRPERWIGAGPEQKKASQPFSTGPRVCLGVNLVYLDVRVALAKVMFNYDLELESKDLDWERDVVLQGVWKKPAQLVKFYRVPTKVS